MPADLYRAQFEEAEMPGTLVIHCSDPRFQPHFQRFLRDSLGLDHYALLAVPGGAHCLTLTEYLPKFSWTGWRWVKFVFDIAKASRLILIAHDECRWYQDLRFSHLGSGGRDHSVRDLAVAKSALHDRFPGISVESYFARLDGADVVFEKL
jgi:hypothetical protein